jgi:hypothetical protein
VAAAVVGSSVASSYEARSSLLLVAPPVQLNQEGEDVPTNPFLLSGQAERIAASSALVVTESVYWAELMKAEGAGGTYEYVMRPEAPIIEITTGGATAAQALQTLDVATRLFEERFEENQLAAGSPDDRLIASDTLTSTDQPVELVGSKIRTSLAVFVLGLIATASAVVVLGALVPNWQPHLRLRDRARSLAISLGHQAASGDGADR